MTRKEAIEKIRKAYENKELGFQRGARRSRYYDKATDSCCAVGVLVKDESLFNSDGNQLKPFSIDTYSVIKSAMINLKISNLYGLTVDELHKLQLLHDFLVIHINSSDKEFKDYLYGLTY